MYLKKDTHGNIVMNKVCIPCPPNELNYEKGLVNISDESQSLDQSIKISSQYAGSF